MNEEDVWDLSPTVQSRPVFNKFTTIELVDFTLFPCIGFDDISGGHRFSVAFSGQIRWISCASLVFYIYLFSRISLPSIDFCLTFVSVLFNYASPYFLK
jgi:hypothetical protein